MKFIIRFQCKWKNKHIPQKSVRISRSARVRAPVLLIVRCVRAGRRGRGTTIKYISLKNIDKSNSLLAKTSRHEVLCTRDILLPGNYSRFPLLTKGCKWKRCQNLLNVAKAELKSNCCWVYTPPVGKDLVIRESSPARGVCKSGLGGRVGEGSRREPKNIRLSSLMQIRLHWKD